MNTAFPRVLVIDDEHDIREVLEYGLGNAGFDVRTAPDGRTAIEVLKEWTPEALVLDVMLPGIDGMSLIPALRRVTDIPILMLTGRAQTADKVSALTRGADDYIAKPFSPNELVARVRALLRRAKREAPLSGSAMAYGPITVDSGQHTVAVAGVEVALTAKEFLLLEYLLQHRLQLIVRGRTEEIAGRIIGDAGEERAERTLRGEPDRELVDFVPGRRHREPPAAGVVDLRLDRHQRASAGAGYISRTPI